MTESGQPGQERPAWLPTGAGGASPTPPPADSPPPGTGAAGATPSAPAAAGGQPPVAPEEPDKGGRPAWLLPVAIGVGVLVIGGVAVGAVLANRGSDEPAPPPAAVTSIVPVPTPDVEPVERTATTPFAAALPSTVLQYALASSDPSPEWVDAGALEAYAESYTDGAGAEVTMLVGQWATQDEARQVYLDQAKALGAADAGSADAAGDTGGKGTASGDATPEPTRTQSGDVTAQEGSSLDALPQTGPVRVGDKRVGTYTAVDQGDGTGVVVWFNETGVFRAVVPVDDALDFYRAFPV